MISNIELKNLKDYYNYNCKYTDDILKFDINNNKDNDIDISFVNSIRRIIEEENEAYFLNKDTFNILRNNTIYNNDIVIHIISSLPYIKKFGDKYDINNLTIELNILNDNEYPIEIKSSDLIFKYNDKVIDRFVTYNNIILFNVVRPGEGINISYSLKKSNPIKDGAFLKQCCKNIFTYKINEKLLEEMINKEDFKDEKDLIHYKIENKQLAYDKNKYNKPMIYSYEIESNGIVSGLDSLKEGVCNIKLKLNNILKNLKYPSDDYFSIKANENNPNITNILFYNETCTLGNVISHYLSRNSKLLNSSSSFIPHPLDNKLYIYLHFKDSKDNNIDNAKIIIEDTIKQLLSLYDKFINYF